MSLIPSGFAKSAAAAGFYDHPIEQSLRLNDDDSAYLSWTPASAGNRKTWTISVWVKRGNISLGDNATLLVCRPASLEETSLRIETSNKLHFFHYNGTDYSLYTDAVFRDPSAWYHVVAVCDTSNATAADRLRIYVNGERQSVTWVTQPPLNFEGWINTAASHDIGYRTYSSDDRLDGYLAEYHFIDGTALDASSFGETKSGVWIPKAYSGSYGTNGFYLDFGNSGSIGADVSGNGNNFTANNLAATDVVLDSPTNNFATWNALSAKNSPVLSEGNLKTTGQGTGSYRINTGTIGVTSGKWYFETVFKGSLSSENASVGITTQSFAGDINNSYLGNGSTEWAVMLDSPNDILKSHSGLSSYSDTWADGDVFQVAFDVDAQDIWFGKNGTWYASGNPSAGTNAAYTDLTSGATFYPAVSMLNSDVFVSNFGQDSSFAGNKTAQGNTDDNGYGDFYYAPPTGYLALCTANLTVPDAMNPALDNSPQDYFAPVAYTGDGTSSRNISVGFQSDFSWIKCRSLGSTDHLLFDAVRGAGAYLRSHMTSQEYSTTGMLDAFNADGFQIGSNNDVNASGRTFISWNWKANGSGVSNTDGSITSTVSANTDAGFSIITYTGDGGTTSTIGHGLNEAPDIAIFKCRNTGSTGWIVNSPSILGTGQNLILNTTAAKAYSASSDFVYGASTIQLDYGDWANGSGRTYVCYAFHSVEGFSKFGSYTGNGSTDGPFIYTGFRPAFVMIKRTDSSSYAYWIMMDTARNTYNVMDQWLHAESSEADRTNPRWDVVSNGIKHRNNYDNHNASGGTYIYMAFAENPFKYSTAR